ncbi:uncharacterized protein BJ171DRAFT_508605 [Polychytrium aggregatum]|uniref:uncharacterized protein n=1 Tax=Polychytrium aggregatum TaxID=110093 RepID=UPI0022FDC838|nr:uncharacterized protein BJ171DRAFT_508605 [Polychytrium aggregatum]KAI9203896.1 hypothetical protein BJ171DRAFT_508605 [Polychytrium aggregatum]
MAAVRASAQRIDWTSLSAKLKPETVASLNGFRRRHAELTKVVQELKESKGAIDFAHYQKVLKNQKVVSDAQSAFNSFKPASYDLKEQLRIIDQEEAKAVADAQKTAAKINAELVELKQLLTHIETARPVDQLTVDDVAQALPELDQTVAKMVKRGQWTIPGYYERYGEFVVGL